MLRSQVLLVQVEDPKKALLLYGGRTSQTVKDVLSDFGKLKAVRLQSGHHGFNHTFHCLLSILSLFSQSYYHVTCSLNTPAGATTLDFMALTDVHYPNRSWRRSS